MTILDRYITGLFARLFLLVMAALLSIYLLVDFFERIDNFLAADKSFALAGRYLFLKIPQIAEQLLPVCIMLAGVLTVGILNQTRELMALNAGGIGAGRIIRPLLVVTAVFIGLALASAEWLQPLTTSVTNRIWFEEVKGQIPKGTIRDGRTFYSDDKGIYSFVRNPEQENRLRSFTYAEWDNVRQLRLLLTAEEAVWSSAGWLFTNGQLKTRQENGAYKISSFSSSAYDLKAKPADFFLPPRRIEETSLSELFGGKTPARSDAHRSRTDRHKRLSYLFLGLPLLLAGIPIMLAAHQGRRRDLALTVPTSCVIAFLAWGWWSISQSLAAAGSLPVLPAAWSIHVLAGLTGSFLILSRDR